MTADHPGTGKASIIILTYNNIELTRLCLESTLGHTTYPEYEIIVVDNASRDGTPAYLQGMAEKHSNLRLVLNEENVGFARGNNLGFAGSTGDFIVFLNNDTVVTQGWLTGLVRYLEDPQVGMVGPVTNSSGNETQIPVDYDTLDEMHLFARDYTEQHKGQSFDIAMLPFQCVALRRQVLEQVGPLDESFGQGMFEDDDYALRLKQHGYRILCAEDVFIHHWGSASFSRIGNRQYWQLFTRNLKIFEQKWNTTWSPPTQRAEFIPHQYRAYLDNAIMFSEKIDQMEDRYAWQRRELENIYQSSSWALIQRLQRARRAVFPEGSRREQFLFSILHRLRRRRSAPPEEAPVQKATRETADRAKQVQMGQGAGASKPDTKIPTLVKPDPEGLRMRSANPLVSVILPVYNHAHWLAEAVDSILFSTYPNLELIILDDGSTDDIEPVLERLSHNPRVRIYRQPNQKLPRALTHAHRFARGQFITWTSADNLLMPVTIERLVDALLQNPHAVMVYADVSLIDEHGDEFRDGSYRQQNLDPGRIDFVRLHRDPLPLTFEGDNYINACFLYRREAATALDGRFADELPGLEDYDFWMRMQKYGDFLHIRNQEPLYRYRVHRQTISHAILSQEQELVEHVDRLNRLLEYEERRREVAQTRWQFILDESLDSGQKKDILHHAQSLSVDLSGTARSPDTVSKRLPFVSEEGSSTGLVYVQSLPDHWRLVWSSHAVNHWNQEQFWKGIEIHPLARKARDLRTGGDRYPDAGQRPIAGLHTGLATFPVDIEATRHVIASDPAVYFVLIDVPGEDDPVSGEAIVDGLDNAAYLESYPLGEPYRLYADWNAVWLPPTSAQTGVVYRESLALAYAIGRPLVAPGSSPFIPAPYQYCYNPSLESLEFIRWIDRSGMDIDLLNQYLEKWSPSGNLEQILDFANAATQELFTPRPDFKVQPPQEEQPVAWTPVPGKGRPAIKCGLVVRSLDKGGLEQFVAQLALGLPDRDVETFVVCTERGGTVADTLIERGKAVHLTHSDDLLMRQVLEREQPDILNTYLVDLQALQIFWESGIPLIETAQNSYIWFDPPAWQNERQRSLYFTHLVAVSQSAKQYYLKWNNAWKADWVTVIPNGIDVKRLQPVEREEARLALGVKPDQFLFVNIASYALAKNQLGTMAAFNRIAGDHPLARMMFVGNTADQEYYQKASRLKEQLPCSYQIELRGYTRDISLIYSAADSFVLNSFYEGWSLAATEALIAGVPLIHSNCGSAYQLAGENQERGIVVPNPACAPLDLTGEQVQRTGYTSQQANTDILAGAMAQMVDQRFEWLERKDSIRDYAVDNFSFKRTLDSYSRLIRQTLGF